MIIIAIIPTFLVINYFAFIKSRIYFKNEYDIKVSDSNDLVKKIELVDYSHYLNAPKNNLTTLLECNYIDYETINYINDTIKNDTQFHLFPGYSHSCTYSFYAERFSQIYFTYNNETVFNSTYVNNSLMFSTWSVRFGTYYGRWYINFAKVPYISTEKEKIILTDITFVKMILNYGHIWAPLGGKSLTIDQYIILDNNFEIIAIIVPEIWTGIA